MSRKDYIIKLLTALQDDRPLAQGLMYLIQLGKVDDATIDALSKMFMDTVDKVHLHINEEKMKQGVHILQKIKLMEQEENLTSDLKALEDMIDAL